MSEREKDVTPLDYQPPPPRVNYRDRRLAAWLLVTFLGGIVSGIANKLDDLPGILGVALGVLLSVAGAIGMLRRFGHLQDEAKRK
jgi:hypothetical protein